MPCKLDPETPMPTDEPKRPDAKSVDSRRGLCPRARPLRHCGPELQSARRSIDAGVVGLWLAAQSGVGIKENIDSPFPADYSTGYCWSGVNNGDTQLWRMRNIVWEFCVRRRPCSLTKWFKHGPMAKCRV